MGQIAGTFLPLLLFMLSPILIPVCTSLIGRLFDAVTTKPEASPALRATEAARHAAATRKHRAEVASVS
jgi:hypothetical protein